MQPIKQPGLGVGPVTVDRALGVIEQFGDLRDGESGVVSQFDDLRDLRFFLSEFLEGLMAGPGYPLGIPPWKSGRFPIPRADGYPRV